MIEWQSLLIGVAVGLALAGFLIALSALREVREIGRNPSLPYWVRNGLEDLTVPNIRMRMMLEQVRAYVDNAERELKATSELMGDIRNGEYDQDQPHKKR
jgi:hypothetical protein